MKHRALTALMIVAVAFGFAFAQPGPAATAPAAAAKAQAPMPGPAIPDLTPEQMEKIDNLRTAHVKGMVPLRADLKVKEIELGALWRADEPDAKRIIAKVKEIGDVREKIEIARINHRFDMRKLFTPEQRNAMKKMGMGRGMMGRGMQRGMRGMKHGRMGGEGHGMHGGCQGPMKGQGGESGCLGCDMH
ncbi:periplasmic heavy metal sensor [candidate division WOR-3 bacterium]|nr:periplasmic heavy metal sensor [candidate division WOR-3 bacterium]